MTRLINTTFAAGAIVGFVLGILASHALSDANAAPTVIATCRGRRLRWGG